MSAVALWYKGRDFERAEELAHSSLSERGLPEMLLGRPLRKHGGPAGDIQGMFSPWLFQAPAGSYQFAVRMREPVQLPLWELGRPKIEGVTSTFFSVLRAAASGKEEELASVVPDVGYRGAFLNLSRGLAPTGRTFTRLEIKDASRPTEPNVTFETETRQDLNRFLRNMRNTDNLDNQGVQDEISGILRGVQLDRDWLEVRIDEEKPPVHISGVGEVLDDVIGPMVNRRVIVKTLRRGNKHRFQDIELEE